MTDFHAAFAAFPVGLRGGRVALGVHVQGYFAWSILDNAEHQDLVHTGQRTSIQ